MNTQDKIKLVSGLTLIVAGAATIAISFIKLNRLEKAWNEKIQNKDEAAIKVEENMSTPL